MPTLDAAVSDRFDGAIVVSEAILVSAEQGSDGAVRARDVFEVIGALTGGFVIGSAASAGRVGET